MKHDIQERKEDLEDTKEVVVKFERRISIEVRRQENLDIAEEKDFRRRRATRKIYGKNIIWIE